jgi:hypothetical protein
MTEPTTTSDIEERCKPGIRPSGFVRGPLNLTGMFCAESNVANSSTIVRPDTTNQEEQEEEEDEYKEECDDDALLGDEQARSVDGFFRPPFPAEQEAHSVKPATAKITGRFASANLERSPGATVVGVDRRRSCSGPNVPIGMANLGRTCYFNACMQCLVHLKPSRSYGLGPSFDHDLASQSRLQGTGAARACQRLQALIDQKSPIAKADLE